MSPQQIVTLLDTHEGSTCIVLGSAPSIRGISNHPADVGIFVGDSMLRTAVRLKHNYYVRANTFYPNLERALHVKDLKKLGAKSVFAQSVPESGTPVFRLLEELERESNLGTFVFDQRHFFGKPCKPRAECCEALHNAATGPSTIQELLATYCGGAELYSSGSTVSLHAVALAVMLGASEVHIAGVEVPTLARNYVYPRLRTSPWDQIVRRLDAALYQAKRLLSHYPIREIPGVGFRWMMHQLRTRLSPNAPSAFAPDAEAILKDFEIIFNLAKKRGVKIYICSATSSLNGLSEVKPCNHSPE